MWWCERWVCVSGGDDGVGGVIMVQKMSALLILEANALVKNGVAAATAAGATCSTRRWW